MPPPPFRLTSRALRSLTDIAHGLGRLQGLEVVVPQPRLRKRNAVRTVHASVAIEGNALSEAQVTAVLDGHRVVGAERDVREIVNVNAAYEALAKWQPASPRSLRAAHAVVMHGLIEKPGRFRTGSVGVVKGTKVQHLAPPAHLVTSQIASLLRWVGRTDDHPLIVGCVAHYELLFIHPFVDGNGRVARLWQQAIHARHSPLLAFVPVESIVRERQRAYYRALRESDRAGECSAFLEFQLKAISDALDEFSREVRVAHATTPSRLEQAAAKLGARWFSRRDYLAHFPKLSTASASRDLVEGVAENTLKKRGARRLTEYRFVTTRRSARRPGAPSSSPRRT